MKNRALLPSSRGALTSLGLPTSLAVALAFMVAPRVALADIVPEGVHSIKVAVTFSSPTDAHVVAYPTDCMGLDPKLNPQLEFFQNYDVIEPGKPREPYKFCDEKTKIWILDSEAFKKTPGEKVPAFVRSEWKLEQLSKVSVPERPLFFQKSPHVHATGYSMPGGKYVKDESPLTEIAETVTFAGLPAKVANVKLVYKYKDGQSEEHTYAVGSRPQPKRAEARDWMAGLVDEKPDAGAEPADAGAGAGAETADAGRPALLDRKLFVVTSKKAPERPVTTSLAEEPTSKRGLGRSGKLMLGFALVAALAAGFALREEKKG